MALIRARTSELRRTAIAVLWFCGLTLLLTWSVWSLLWVLDIRFPSPLDPRLLSSSERKIAQAGMFMPALSALIVTRFVLRESWRTTTLDRLGAKRFYAWAWLLPLLIVGASGLLSVLFGVVALDPGFKIVHLAAARKGWPLPPGSAAVPWVLGYMLVSFALGTPLGTPMTLGEELGWRGFLLPRLMAAGLGQRSALIITGAFWGLWHAPVILRGLNFPERQYLGVLLMVVFCTLLGFLYGWLYLASGSVWVAAVAHSSWDSVAAYPVLLTTGYTANVIVAYSIIGWLPLIVLIAWLALTSRLPVEAAAESPGV